MQIYTDSRYSQSSQFICEPQYDIYMYIYNVVTNLVPKPAKFLRRMLDENKGSGKDQFLGNPDWLSEM